ncbi:MAG: hypothetical protein WKG06_21550 [Segetibacter sp.]
MAYWKQVLNLLNGLKKIYWLQEQNKLPQHILYLMMEAEKMIKTHVCLCYDICHFAIGYEPHAEIIKQLEQDGIKVGKIQISAALKAPMRNDPSYRLNIKEAFTKFNEPTYLHQVVASKNDAGFLRYPDLTASFGRC